MDPKYLGLFFLAIGLFSILGSALNWGFFVNHRKAQFIKRILGETGMKIFYVVFGGLLMVLGGMVTFGFINLQ